jgi:glycosyltransferase involved in cell wall biosynthesis
VKNILLFIDNLGSGGAQRQMVTLAKLLKQEGYDVSFLVYDKANFFANILEEEKIAVCYCDASSYFFRIIKIRKIIRKGNYNTVISFLDTPNFLNCISAIGGKSWKVIISERSNKPEFLQSIRGRVFKWIYKFSDAIVCNSNSAKDMWQKHCPYYSNKLVAIYNPVLLPPITSQYIPKRANKLHLVVAASFQYLKNSIGLAQALSLLNEEERALIHIDWYGEKNVSLTGTNAFDETIRIIENNHMEDAISLHEPTKNIGNIMNEADMIGLFSRLEGLPNAICEGMMIGKPIIMTRVSDYSQLVDEANGILCDWNFPESIKEALLYAIQLSPDALKEMGKESKLKAEKIFSTSKIRKQWLSIV